MPSLVRKIARLIAFVLLALSLLFPWLRVPISVSEKPAGGVAVSFNEPVSTIIFKAFILAVLLILCWLAYRQRRSGPTHRKSPMTAGGATLLIIIAIAYPALTMQRCAAISAHASWLQAQNYSLIKPDGDSFNAQEFFYQSQQPAVDVREVLPRSFIALPSPLIYSFSDLRLSKLEEVTDWLGLSEAFCQFIRRGWFCAIFGSFLLAVSFMCTKDARDSSCRNIRHGHSMRPFAVLGALSLCGLCLAPVVIAGRELAWAQTATLDGRFSQALEHINAAQAWMPVFAYNTDLICQRGWLEQKLEFNSPAVQLLSAVREEEEGFRARAAQHYSDLLDQQAPGPVREEAFRGALRLALNDFNSGLLDRADYRLKQLAEIDPTCVKAYYALQLADLRSGQKENLERDTAKFEAVYNCFQSLEKSSLIASAHRRVAELEFDYRDIGRLGEEMRAAVKPAL
jgi:tetratricopeptide (TPR) repeat protein